MILIQERPPEMVARSASTIEIEVISDPARLHACGKEWQSLVAQDRTSSIFQTFEWNESWWAAFGDEHQLLVLLARVDRQLVGIAPLMVTKQHLHGRRQRLVEFIGTGVSDYANFIIVAPGREREVLQALLNRLIALPTCWDLIHLHSVPKLSPTAAVVFEYFRHRGYKADWRVVYDCPTYLFGDGAADKRLVRKKSLRRHFNYYQRGGRLEFRHCTSLQEAEAYLEPFFDQHIRRRALTDTPSAFHDERQRAFFSAVTRALLPHGWLRFSVVLHNDQPIAFHFGFEYGNRIIWYKPSFEPSHAEHSPGEVLIKYLLEDALARGISEFDLTIGDEAFKQRFANHMRHTETVRVFRRASLYYLEQLLIATKGRIKSSPMLWRGVRKVQRFLTLHLGQRSDKWRAAWAKGSLQ